MDFACREQKLVIEIDGWSHDVSQAHDRQRDEFLRFEGYQVLRFTNEQVTANLEGVVTMIVDALAAAPSPSPSRKREGK